jgi:hypothetical protein
MAVVIRPCRPDEGPALLDLWHHADASPSPTDTPEQVDQVIRDSAAAVLVAIETGPGNVIRRCHPHDPSWENWPVIEHSQSMLKNTDGQLAVIMLMTATAAPRLAGRIF